MRLNCWLNCSNSCNLNILISYRAVSVSTSPALLSSSSSSFISRYWEKSRFPRSGLVSKCARTSEETRETWFDIGLSIGLFGLDGRRPRRPFKLSVLTTSFTIPTVRHFWNLQNWQRFLRRLSTGQFLSARQTYLAFFWTVLLKNPLQPSHVRTP